MESWGCLSGLAEFLRVVLKPEAGALGGAGALSQRGRSRRKWTAL